MRIKESFLPAPGQSFSKDSAGGTLLIVFFPPLMGLWWEGQEPVPVAEDLGLRSESCWLGSGRMMA